MESYLIPTVTCFAVPTIWYTVLIFGYPCRTSFMYGNFHCGTLCYLTNLLVFINFENFFVWRNNLRMISQLMFIAVLYMSVYVPSCLLLIFGSYVRRSLFQSWTENVRIHYFTHLKYLVIYGCPFMVFPGQKEMYEKLRKFLDCMRQLWRSRRAAQIHPVAMINIQN